MKGGPAPGSEYFMKPVNSWKTLIEREVDPDLPGLPFQLSLGAEDAYDLGGIASVIGDFSHCGENILTSTVTLGPRRARTELATRHVMPHAVTACPVR